MKLKLWSEVYEVVVVVLLLTLGLVSCAPDADQQGSNLKLRNMNQEESLSDFNQLVSSVRSFYGPLHYKERRFNFKFDDWVEECRQELLTTSTDSQVLGVFTKFLAKFQDAHVGLKSFQYRGSVTTYSVPIFLTPFLDENGETKAYVGLADITMMKKGVKVYDELVSIDGKPTMDYLSEILKYGSIGNPESDKHMIHKVLQRPAYMTSMLPKKNLAHLVFKNKEGKTYQIHTVWQVKEVKNVHFVDDGPFSLGVERLMDLNVDLGDMTVRQMGDDKPFFLTTEVKKKFELKEVKPSDEMLEKHGLKPKGKLPPVYAAVYKHDGKDVLLARNSTYSHGLFFDGFSNEDFMKYYRALFEEYESQVDVLLLDQTHNGGGSYCVDFFSLFVDEQVPGFVQATNADRKWMRAFDRNWARKLGTTADMVTYMSHEIEHAIDNNRRLSKPIPLFGEFLVTPDEKYTWKKPMLVMIDELAASCADAFPMLVKRNNVAKLFGMRTVGAGGNVEPVVELNHSGAQIRMTRGSSQHTTLTSNIKTLILLKTMVFSQILHTNIRLKMHVKGM